MYKISVPVKNENLKRNGREKTLSELRRFDAERVFVAFGTYELDSEKRKQALCELADNCKFFKENGFEVGTWLWTFMLKGNRDFRHMRAVDGTELEDYMCPTDENFIKFACDYVKDLARCGVELIMFDDDFRYTFLGESPACLCDGHIAEINRITGEKLTREELHKYIISGGKNKYRDAYIKANGDAFRKFAHAIRNAVDEIDSSIRIGACTCMGSWDIDGVNAYELATILAGKTKPFCRLIGAPYWGAKHAWGNELQDTVELERMESVWTRQGDIEIMAEGDVWPRPRTLCPASYLEGFDMAIRVSGCTDGILKYGIDYISNADYETGYAKYHERNRETYKKISEMFDGKTPLGVRVYESAEKLSDMVMPTKVNSYVSTQDMFFSKASRTLAYNSVPTVFDGDGVCGIVFDENARNMPTDALKKGLILDIAAAEILKERGIDVGIEEFGESLPSEYEHFLNDNNHIISDTAVFGITLKEGAEILSDTETPNGKIPMSYLYENADGNRFLVLNINSRSEKNNPLRHYSRSRQYAESIKWLSGKPLPAYVYGNPSLYVQCKTDENALAVALFNFFADTAMEPVVELSKSYESIRFINCNGTLKRDKVYLTDISPFGFAAFEVK